MYIRFFFLRRTLGKFAAKCATWDPVPVATLRQKIRKYSSENIRTSRASIGASGRIVWRTLRMGSWTLKCWFHSSQKFSHLVPVSCGCAVGLRAFGGTHPHHLRQKSFHKIQHWKAQTSIGQYTKTLLTIKRLSPKGKCWLEQHCTLSTFPKTDCCGLSALPRKVGSCRPPIFAKPLFVESLPLVLSVF